MIKLNNLQIAQVSGGGTERMPDKTQANDVGIGMIAPVRSEGWRLVADL